MKDYLSKIHNGFSLIEVLISLGIVAILTVFTIPFLVNSSLSTKADKQTRVLQNVAYMVISGYEKYRSTVGNVPSTFTSKDLSPYLNYVSVDTSSYVDAHINWVGQAGNGRNQCTTTNPCLYLHSGGKLWLRGDQNFGGIATTNAIEMAYDPDTTTTGTTADDISKSIQFELYYNGYLKTRGQSLTNTCTSLGCGISSGSFDASWFSGF